MSTQTSVNAFFQPTQISGCALWLDATNRSSFTFNSPTTISAWNDRSTNNLSGSAVNSPTYVANVLNGLPVVRFNGTSQYIDFGNVLNLGTNSLSIFVVTKFVAAVSGGKGIVGKASYRANSGRWAMTYEIQFASGMTTFIEDGTNGQATFVFNPSTQFNVFSTQNNRTSTNRIYANGTLGSQVSFTQATNNLSNTDRLFVAAYPNNTGLAPQAGYYLEGDIGEVLVYFANITDAQRQQIEGYLAWKWGLQANLPSNHPYKSSPIAPLLNPPTTNSSILGNFFFLPSQISGLSLWLDAADTTTVSVSGSTVTAWRDKSSLAYTGTSSAGRNFTYVSNILNRLNCIQTATGQTLTISNFVLGPTMSVFLLYFPINQSTASPFIEQGPNANSSAGFYMYSGGLQSFFINNGGAGTFIDAGNVTVSNTWQMLEAINKDPNASNTMSFYTNGTVRASGGNTTTNSTTTATLFINGRNNTNTVSIASYIAEIIIYNVAVSNSQRQQIEGYLAWKWGLPSSILPATHPYRSTPLTTPVVYATPTVQIQFSSWQPTFISGLALWLDAADRNSLILSGSNVNQWRDKSGNGNNTTTQTSNNPTYQQNNLNGQATIGFQSSSDGLVITSNNFNMSSFPSLCYFIVIRPSSTQPNTTFAGILSTDTLNQYGRSLGLGTGNWQQEYYSNFQNITPYTANVWAIVSLQFNSTVSTTLAVNGITFTATPTAFGNNTQGLKIGSYSSTYSSFNANFDTGEILIYGANITTAQRQQIEGYLAWKWGLQSSLPATHPFSKWPPPP
jgi:hypothetical protein